MFYVGQKVVCVDASAPKYHGAPLTLGAIYTVSGVDPENGRGVYLVEVPDDPPEPPFQYPYGWRQSRFRPAVERKTDISALKEILNNPHKQLEGV